MITDFVVSLFKHYADVKGWDLSKNHESIIESIVARDGNCPCRVDKVQCLSCDVAKDIVSKGRCHCGLFIMKKD